MCQIQFFPAYRHLRGSWSAEAWDYILEYAVLYGVPPTATWRSRRSNPRRHRRGYAIITASWDGGLPDAAKTIMAEGIRACW